MKPKDRMDLIIQIGRELQAEMTTTDINTYLCDFGIKTLDITMASSKWVYVKQLLSDVDDSVIIKVAMDLGLDIPSQPLASSTDDFRKILQQHSIEACIEDFDRAISNLESDPANAVGMASTTLETMCKAILDTMGESYPKDESLTSLYKEVQSIMNLSPEGYADPQLKRILGGLTNTAAGLATLRTKFSTFHGRGSKQYRLGKRHARLAINSMATVGLFLLETFDEKY